MKKQTCICPNTGCLAYRDCKTCTSFHKWEPYCRSERTRKLVEEKIKKYGVMR